MMCVCFYKPLLELQIHKELAIMAINGALIKREAPTIDDLVGT